MQHLSKYNVPEYIWSKNLPNFPSLHTVEMCCWNALLPTGVTPALLRPAGGGRWGYTCSDFWRGGGDPGGAGENLSSQTRGPDGPSISEASVVRSALSAWPVDQRWGCSWGVLADNGFSAAMPEAPGASVISPLV